MKRRTLKELIAIAKHRIRNRGAKLLSVTPCRRTRLTIKCKGHIWKTRLDTVLNGHWCQRCWAEKKKIGLARCSVLASRRGGQCLATSYDNNAQKLLWDCSKGHPRFRATIVSVERGYWCKHCSGRYLTIKQMKQAARDRGGKCLSGNYASRTRKLVWFCSRHEYRWEATPARVLSGSWCRLCSYERRRQYCIGDLSRIAALRGGRFLGNDFRNRKTPVVWQCRLKHSPFSMRLEEVLKGQWCPLCASGRSERACRAIFEQLLKTPFPKARPSWLRNSRGNQMELDGYSAKLNLAFEYHGPQHYVQHSLFHKRGSLASRRADDKRKRTLCKQKGVGLIEISHRVKLEEYPLKIKTACDSLGIPLRQLPRSFKPDLRNASSPEFLDEIRKVSAAKGGSCLSNYYISAHDKMKFRCSKGHCWRATPNHIKSGTWCPECSKKRTGNLSRLNR